jgi:hypothetical protein
MYKPNGEEPMTKQEEMRCKQLVAAKAAERQREAMTAGSLRSAFYTALSRSSAPLEEKVGILL